MTSVKFDNILPSSKTKLGLARMLKGGVIMDVVSPEQAKIAEEAGAVAVMALERVPADIRKSGGVARMSDVSIIEEIQKAVSIPVMAKVRIGHTMEAKILEQLEVDFIDESEVLSPADEVFHVDKRKFEIPFVCGCRNLGEALRRINEGASMIRTKGEAGTGNVIQAVRHIRTVNQQIEDLRNKLAQFSIQIPEAEKDNGIPRLPEWFESIAAEMRVPLELLWHTVALGRLPVVTFAAGGVATPADAALMMHLGMDGVFVGSGIFKSHNPKKRACAIVEAVTHWNDPKKLVECSRNLGEAMVGIGCDEMVDQIRMEKRGF